MKQRYRILLTGVGSEPGLSAAKALREYFGQKIYMVGVDANPMAPGLYLKGNLFDQTYLVPKALDPTFIEQIVRVARKEGVDVLFPASDAEIFVLSGAECDLHDLKLIGSLHSTVLACRDKWLTFKELDGIIPMPKTSLVPSEVKPPCIIKPRVGHGAQGIHRAFDEKSLVSLGRQVKDPIYQELIDGEEWTIDCVCSTTGELIVAVPRKRLAYPAGTSQVGEVVRDANLIAMAERLTRHLPFLGPFCFQTRDGKLFEINPRIAAASIFSAAAGANTAAIAVMDSYGDWKKAPVPFKEIIALRFLKEIFLDKKDIKGREPEITLQKLEVGGAR